MEASIAQNTTPQPYISEYAALIKKMRLLRKLRRKQAAHFLPFNHKNIEKLENGRGDISLEQFKLFQSTYGFTDNDVEALRLGKYKVADKNGNQTGKVTTGKRRDRRFCHRKITRECKVLKELRLSKGIDQYTASKDCLFGRNTIGFIENGRVTLTEKKIKHISILTASQWNYISSCYDSLYYDMKS
jgi:transcriptional regulator with XRE-family HTH domain